MNTPQAGFQAGVLLGSTGVGAMFGLVPLFLGVRQGKTWMAVGGFLASVVGGLVAGVYGAAILAGIFCFVIRPWDETATGAMPGSPGGSKRGTALGWYLVVMFFVQTVCLAVFWSLFMSLSTRKSFVSILVPWGAIFGLTMGIFITPLLAVVMRTATVRVRVGDRADFLGRLDRVAGKLRYRPLPIGDHPDDVVDSRRRSGETHLLRHLRNGPC
jgi:hypothetical protein